MELTEDQIIEKYGKHCGHCNRNMLLPYEYEWTNGKYERIYRKQTKA